MLNAFRKFLQKVCRFIVWNQNLHQVGGLNENYGSGVIAMRVEVDDVRLNTWSVTIRSSLRSSPGWYFR